MMTAGRISGSGLPKLLRLALLLAAAMACAAAAPVSHHAYIWQRIWTPGVSQAVKDSTRLFQVWRVLAAETDARGRLRAFPVEWAVLAGKPVTAVVRINGTLQRFDAKALAGQIKALAARWPKGVGLEIDYDCGTYRLADYARFLTALRGVRRLSITALPTWMESGDLDGVLAAADEAVLQVHAIRAPSQGLFDAKPARRWIDAFDRRTTKPFRVALPDYGTRVIRDGGGTVIALESEAPKLIGGAAADELMATPGDVSSLLRDLQARPPVHWRGIVWFRLPVDGDARVWSLPTLAAVIEGRPLKARIVIDVPPGAGARDIVLINDGEVDAPLPARIDLPRTCRTADGINGYRYEAQNKLLRRLQNGLLRAHHRRVIGWARCDAARGDFHVEP